MSTTHGAPDPAEPGAAPDPAGPGGHGPAGWSRRWGAVALGAGGAAVTLLASLDGRPLGQAVRAVVGAALTAGGVALLRRARPGVRGATAVGFGAVCLAVGIGIAVPHLVKTGLTVRSLLGTVALVAGVALVATGVAVLWGATRRWGRAGAVAASLVGVAVVANCLGIAVAATNVAPTALGPDTPADRGLVHRDVELRTADGITLSGWYVPSSNGAAVALVHGAGSTRSSVLDHAGVLARRGYGVLLFDARGHGRSGGRAMDLGWYGDEDVGAAVDFLAVQPDVDPGRIAAVGLSMGGEEALGAAAADPRIAAVVAEGATNRVPADKAWLTEVYGLRGWLQRGLDVVTYGFTDLLTGASPPTPLRGAVAAVAPRPVLLVTAGRVADEGHAARWLQAAAPATVAVWEVAGAGHTDGLAVDPAGWEDRVTTFLAAALAPS